MHPELPQSAKHRFNKAQQDAFLPHIERGTIIFVGATTENPSFELNSALLSRCRVHVMEAVSPDDIRQALQAALDDAEHGLGGLGLQVDDEGGLLDGAGAPARGLHAIGPLTRGAFWEMTAVPDLRGQARDLAARILSDRP